MSPIELVFIVVIAMFGVIGIVRGVGRELGITTMLFIGLLVLKLLEEGPLKDQFNQILNTAFGVAPTAIPSAIALIACILLTVIAFISYEGVTLSFNTKINGWALGLIAGLINGYLYAGSVWYYLQVAGWPLIRSLMRLDLATKFTQPGVENKFLPPAIFNWEILIFMVIFLLIIRVWK